MDDQAVLPAGALAQDRYVRRYLLTNVMIGDDTPYFTTQTDFAFDGPRQVWVGVYSLGGSLNERDQPGVRVVSKPEEMPELVHGGCETVNLVADARSGETLASWCNIDDRLAPNGSPSLVPEFRLSQAPDQ